MVILEILTVLKKFVRIRRRNLILIGANLLCYTLSSLGLMPFSFNIIQGNSMSPTYSSGDVVLVTPYCKPTAGTPVILDAHSLNAITQRVHRAFNVDSSNDPKINFYAKRVVAIAGQSIPPYGEQSFANANLKVPLSLVHAQFAPNPGTVPFHAFWVLGDNTQDSIDSRFWGSVPTSLVKSCILAKVFRF